MGDVTTDCYLLGRVFEGEINLLHYSYGHPERSAEAWADSSEARGPWCRGDNRRIPSDERRSPGRGPSTPLHSAQDDRENG